MAAATGWAMLRAAVRGVRAAGRPMRGTVPSLRPCSTQRTPEASSPYKDKPWEYLDSDEYQQLYGDGPVWVGYKRNHKGAIPPQRTRRTCVRKGKRVGNPCPICRDQNLHVDYRNVKLLEQFVCPHSGSIFHPTHTGVCMKQHKLLLKAIAQAQDHGLLWLRVPFVPPPSDDYLTLHSAIGKTPPGPQLKEGRAWYPWYQWQQPPAAAIARLRRIYKDYLKEEEGEQREAEALNKEHKTGLEMGVEGQEKGVEGQKGGIKG